MKGGYSFHVGCCPYQAQGEAIQCTWFSIRNAPGVMTEHWIESWVRRQKIMCLNFLPRPSSTWIILRRANIPMGMFCFYAFFSFVARTSEEMHCTVWCHCWQKTKRVKGMATLTRDYKAASTGFTFIPTDPTFATLQNFIFLCSLAFWWVRRNTLLLSLPQRHLGWKVVWW